MAFTNVQTKLSKALVTNTAGDYALRTVMDGEQDLNGEYILNEQNAINQDAQGTAYNLDGTNDKIAAAHNADLDITTGDFSMYREVYVPSLTAAITLWEKWEDAGDYWYLQIETTGAITFKTAIATVTKGHYTTAAGLVTAGTNVKIGFVSDRDGTKGQFYVNLLPVTTTETTAMAATSITNTGTLNWGFDGATGYSEYEDQYGSLWNLAHSAAEVKDVKNIPFKWNYGSQTDEVADPAMSETLAASTAGTNWTTGTNMTMGAGVTDYDAVGAGNLTTQNFVGMEVGKPYRCTFDIPTGTARLQVLTDGLSSFGAPTYATYTGTGQSFEFESTLAVSEIAIRFVNTDGGLACTLDNFSIVQLGAVALYTQDSISETAWYDKANGNDGAVTGAEVLNAPSVTPLHCLRSVQFLVEPGVTPNTNLNISDVSSTINSFNASALTDGTNIAKSGSSGSFSLDASGIYIGVAIPETVVGILSTAHVNVDMNSSSTTEMYFLSVIISSGNFRIYLKKRGAVGNVDWTTVIDAGDSFYFQISYVTAT